MGDRGPIAKTNAEKIARGNLGHRPLRPENHPEAVTKLPAAPLHLTKIAGTEWRRAGRHFVERRKITRTNLKALEAYCMNYGYMREADRIINAPETTVGSGLVSKSGEKGYTAPNPAIAIMNKAQNEMRAWLKVLENTVTKDVKEKKSALEDFREQKQSIRRVK